MSSTRSRHVFEISSIILFIWDAPGLTSLLDSAACSRPRGFAAYGRLATLRAFAFYSLRSLACPSGEPKNACSHFLGPVVSDGTYVRPSRNGRFAAGSLGAPRRLPVSLRCPVSAARPCGSGGRLAGQHCRPAANFLLESHGLWPLKDRWIKKIGKGFENP